MSAPRPGRKPHTQTVPYGSTPFEEAVRALASTAAGRGAVVLFAGPSGEKAAAALAALGRHLSFNIHQVDAAALVGERRAQTQGYVREMFDNASENAAILCFAAADALFHAPAAAGEKELLPPIEYLFQRAAVYQGVVVLCLQEPAHVAEARAHGADLVVTF